MISHSVSAEILSDKCPADAIYPSIANKYWPEFIRTNGYCHTLVSSPNFLHENLEPRDDWCRSFVKWLADKHNITSHEQTLKKATSWLQGKIVHARRCALKAPPPDGHVVRLPVVSDIVKQAVVNSKMKNLHQCNDTAAEFEASISFDEMVRLVEVCNSRKLEGCGELITAQTLYELLSTHQKGIRHDDVRAEIFGMNSTRFKETLGPDGMPIGMTCREGGKVNKNGHTAYSAVLPHKNPLLCTLAAAGQLFLIRFLTSGNDCQLLYAH